MSHVTLQNNVCNYLAERNATVSGPPVRYESSKLVNANETKLNINI